MGTQEAITSGVRKRRAKEAAKERMREMAVLFIEGNEIRLNASESRRTKQGTRFQPHFSVDVTRMVQLTGIFPTGARLSGRAHGERMSFPGKAGQPAD